MWEQIWEAAVNSGLWAMLFVALFVIQIRDSKNRETKYQTLINSLAEKLEIVELIKDDIEEIKQIVKKDQRKPQISVDRRRADEKAERRQQIIFYFCRVKHVIEYFRAAHALETPLPFYFGAFGQGATRFQIFVNAPFVGENETGIRQRGESYNASRAPFRQHVARRQAFFFCETVRRGDVFLA